MQIIKKEILLHKDTHLNIFLFNNKKYLKIMNQHKNIYYYLPTTNLYLLKTCKETNQKSLIINFLIEKKEIDFSFFSLFKMYILQFHKLYRKKIIVKGLGYKINILKKEVNHKNRIQLEFKLGYSHLKNILIPLEINDYYLNKNFITFESFNSCWLGNFVSKIKYFKTPDVYKGKGLHIKNQQMLTLKPVKKK